MAARTKSKVTPDHTTLSRRSALVEIPSCARRHDEPIHLAIDSTGLKIVGAGEWHAHKHQTANTRRSWRKLHLGVDGDGFVLVSRLTESGGDSVRSLTTSAATSWPGL